MDKNSIKKHLSLRFLAEEAIPGLSAAKSAQKESKKINDAANKATEKDMKDYDKAAKTKGKEAIVPKKFTYNKDEKTYHDEMEILNGQEMVKYDNEPTKEFTDRAKKAIEGDSTMGNKAGKDTANAEATFGASSDDFGKNLVKRVKDSSKKRNDAEATYIQLGNDFEPEKKAPQTKKGQVAVENKTNNNPTIKEESKMKRLKFKTPFGGVGNALKLIPESYRVDSKVFEMTDGNESYRMRWEGSLTEGKAVVLVAADQKFVNEDIQKMKHLFNYKSESTLGLVKGNDRINENESFADIWNKTKKLMTEATDIEGTTAPEVEMDKAKIASGEIKPEAHNKTLQKKDGTAPAPKAAGDLDDAVDYAGEHIPAEAKKKLQTKDGVAPAPKTDNLGDAGITQAADAKKHITLKENEGAEEEVDDAPDAWEKPEEDDSAEEKEPTAKDIQEPTLDADDEDEPVGATGDFKDAKLFKSKSTGAYVIVATKDNGVKEYIDVPAEMEPIAMKKPMMALTKIVAAKTAASEEGDESEF